MKELDEATAGTPEQATARRLIAELTAAEKGRKKFLDRAHKIQRRYKRDTALSRREFALLYANTQTILPAVYARPPQPVVTRRFRDADPVGRAASEVLERALSYSIDKQDLDHVLASCALDYVLIGAGVPWERYCPSHGPAVTPEIPVVQITTDAGAIYQRQDGTPYEGEARDDGKGGFTGDGTPFEPVTFEESVTDYVNQDDFGFNAARVWDEVWLVYRRVFMDRRQLVKRFGKVKGEAVKLDYKPPDYGENEPEELRCKASIYEIWDKSTKKAFWISKTYSDGPLDEREDPLGLDGFFPCPRPLFGVLANDSLNPTADFLYYQDQADEVDDLTAKIGVLEKALKVVGFYAATEKANLEELLKSATNTMVPVAGWQTLKEGGGVRGNVEWWPIEQVVNALKAAIELRQQLIADVYQITGISDIMRGDSDPSETATGTRTKAQWGSLRIRTRQKEMMRFARDVLRIKAEVIAETFSIETLKVMTGVDLPMQAEKDQLQAQVQQARAQFQMMAQQAQMTGQPPPPPPQVPPEVEETLGKPSWEDVKALLEDNALRQFRIDIETDSTIEADEMAEKQQATELVTALSGMVREWGPAIAAQPKLAPLAAGLTKFALRRFRAGREMEDTVESTFDALAAGTPQGPPGPPPPPPPDKTPLEVAQVNLEREQVKQTGETQRAEIDAQLAVGDQQIRVREQQIKVAVAPHDPNPQVSA